MTSSFSIELPPEYKWVLPLGLGIVALQHLSAIPVVVKRIRLFKGMKEQFQQEHKGSFGENEDVDDLGFPDTGCGWYSQKLSYADWYTFNCIQRAHLHQVETNLPLLSYLFLGAIKHPRISLSLGVIFLLGRILHLILYTKKGAPKRILGAKVLNLAQFALLATAIVSVVKIIKERSQ